MKKLTDILKEAGIEMGKVYTDKDRPPFKMNEATEYYKSKRKSDDLYYKKVGNKWYKSLASKKGKVEWYVVKYPGDLDSRDMNKINKSKLPSELNEASDKIQVQGVGVYDYKSLSSKVKKMVDDLSKRNRKGNHTGLGKRQLGTLAAMWEALADYEGKK